MRQQWMTLIIINSLKQGLKVLFQSLKYIKYKKKGGISVLYVHRRKKYKGFSRKSIDKMKGV